MEGLSCNMCRHWRRIGPRSEVGRCENRQSGHGFTREQMSCKRFEILLFAELEQRAPSGAAIRVS